MSVDISIDIDTDTGHIALRFIELGMALLAGGLSMWIAPDAWVVAQMFMAVGLYFIGLWLLTVFAGGSSE